MPVPSTPLPPRRPLFPPDPPKRRHNRFAIYVALGVALIFIPLTLQFQNRRAQEIRRTREAAHPTPTPTPPSVEEVGDQSQPAELRQWHMQGVDGITESQARKRFGNPILTRDYNVTYGAFLGPKYGLKHYYLNNSPGFEQRAKDAQVEWNFPQYSTVREIIWKLRESYITLWLGQPLREVNIQGDTANAIFPPTAPGEWVVLDHYRVGQDLVKAPPVSATSPPTP